MPLHEDVDKFYKYATKQEEFATATPLADIISILSAISQEQLTTSTQQPSFAGHRTAESRVGVVLRTFIEMSNKANVDNNDVVRQLVLFFAAKGLVWEEGSMNRRVLTPLLQKAGIVDVDWMQNEAWIFCKFLEEKAISAQTEAEVKKQYPNGVPTPAWDQELPGFDALDKVCAKGVSRYYMMGELP